MGDAMQEPEFTAIIPAFNEEFFVARAIDSVLSQTIRPGQIVVVDDGSTDNTAAVIKQYAADGVEHVFQENGGLASARNAGIRAARGKYVGFLDADDEWKEHLVADVKGIFERYPNLAWATAPYEKLLENGAIEYIRSVNSEMSEGCLIENYFEAQVRFHFSCSSDMFVRRDVFTRVGNFDTSISQYGEDSDMWFRIALIYPQIGYANRIGATYWSRKGSIMDTDPRNVGHHLMRIRKAEAHANLVDGVGLQKSEQLILDWIWTQLKDAADLGNKEALGHISRFYGRRLPLRHRLVLDLTRLFPSKSLWGAVRKLLTRRSPS